jgi:signal transduction histidine kinase
MSSTSINQREKSSPGNSGMSAELDLELWEKTSDGLIFFDSHGNFLGCSLKMQQLSGSAEAARAAFAEMAWPHEFAASGELISVSRHPVAFAAAQAEVLCARTARGMVAAIRIGDKNGAKARDVVADIFSARLFERRTLSRHLHGVLTQDLVTLSLSLSSLREDENAKVSEAIAYVDRCCRGVRALSYVLAPPSFLDAGLIETIHWYAGVLRADAGIDFEVKAPPLRIDPPEEIKDLFFAGLQQMAAAAIWHSHHSAIRTAVSHRAGMLSIQIDCVCDPDETVRESPLLRERARTLAGWTRFTTTREKTSLEISVPWTAIE